MSTNTVSENNDNQIAIPQNQKPRLQSLEQVKQWPVVFSTFNVSKDVYVQVKDLNLFTKFFFGYTEYFAACYLNNVVIPVADVFQLPIAIVDKVLVCGATAFEKTMPCCVNIRTDKVVEKTSDCLCNNMCANSAKNCINGVRTCTNNRIKDVRHFLGLIFDIITSDPREDKSVPRLVE